MKLSIKTKQLILKIAFMLYLAFAVLSQGAEAQQGGRGWDRGGDLVGDGANYIGDAWAFGSVAFFIVIALIIWVSGCIRDRQVRKEKDSE